MTLAENQSKHSDLTETHSLSWSTQQSKITKFSTAIKIYTCGARLLEISNIWWGSEMKEIVIVQAVSSDTSLRQLLIVYFYFLWV